MHKFSVGDRVRCERAYDDNYSVAEKIGTIALIEESGYIAVDYDEEIDGGWDCGGFCRDGHGWFTSPVYLTEIPTESPDLSKKMSYEELMR